MSWQQWQQQQAMPPMMQPPINPAPPAAPMPQAVAPSPTYTADQVAQMQQTWQQWAQWQQSYQQWHQQYGAEFQKMTTMTAAQATMPVIQSTMPPVQALQPAMPVMPAGVMPTGAMPPNMQFQPPLPMDPKPPPPPEAPPSGGYNISSYNTVPPPQQDYSAGGQMEDQWSNQYHQNKRLTKAQKKQLRAQKIQSLEQQQGYQTYQVSAENTYYNTAQPNQQYPPPNKQFQNNQPQNQQFQNNQPQNQQYGQPNQWQPVQPTQNQRQQWQTEQPPSLMSQKLQPPSRATQPPIQPPLGVQNVPQNPPQPPVEELTEAEKKFDKQFAQWEAQFNKWKEQNAEHPDKQQYREYEKKWESWREQLLERREQMRRKRLGLPLTGPIPPSQPSKPTSGGTGIKFNLSKVTLEVNHPPPSHNDEPLAFKPKSAPPVAVDLVPQPPVTEPVEEDTGPGFLLGNSSGGIPGLDLEEKVENVDEAEELKLHQEKQRLDALSKGINNILGDQKILSMLSMVTQNQSVTSNLNITSQSNVQGQISMTEHSLDGSNQMPPYAKPDPVHNFDDQTRSSFTNQPQDDFNRFNKFDDFTNDNFNELPNQMNPENQDYVEEYEDKFEDETLPGFGLPASFGKKYNKSEENNYVAKADLRFHDKFGNFNAPKNDFRNDFQQNKNNFDQHNDFNQSKNDFNTKNAFNQSKNDFNQQRNDFNPRNNDFSQKNIPDAPRNDFGTRNDFSSPNNRFAPNRNDFNRPDPKNDFSTSKRDFPPPKNDFATSKNDFTKPLPDFRSPQNDFNRTPPDFRSQNDFRGQNDFRSPQNDFRSPKTDFKSPQKDFGRNPPLDFNRGQPPPDFNRGPQNDFNRGPQNDFRSPRGDDFGKGPPNRFNRSDFNQGPQNNQNDFRGPQNDFNRGPQNDFNRGPQNNFDKGPNNDFPRGLQNDFNRRGPQNDFNKRPQNDFDSSPRNDFNLGQRNDFSNNFNQGPQNNSNRPPQDDFRGPKPPSLMDINFSQRNSFGDDNFGPRGEDRGFQGDNWGSQDSQGYQDENMAPMDDLEAPPPPETDTWAPGKVVDYEHKSLKKPEEDVLVEPLHMFDYRHRQTNRIPFSERPTWLFDAVRGISEFNPIPQQLRLPQDRERFDERPSFDLPQQLRQPQERERPRFDQMSRYDERTHFDDRNRQKYDKKPQYDNYNDQNRRSYERRDRSPVQKRYKSQREDCDEHDNFDDFDDFCNDEPPRRVDFTKDTSPFAERMRQNDQNNFEDDDFEPTPIQNTNIDIFERDREVSPFSRRQMNETQFNRRQPGGTKRPTPPGGDSEAKRFSGGPADNWKPPATVFDYEPKEMAPKPIVSPITFIDDLLCPPGRFNRPPRIVVILRGPPGSGKTFLARLIKDKEVENGGSAPRILSLDDYFMVEQEKEVVEDGKRVKIKEMVFEYEQEMEESYRNSLVKSFKKTITDGYFPFIIVDNVNDKIKYFGEMWSFAKQNGFQVYVCQLDLDIQNCFKRNIHNRTEAEIKICVDGWENTPSHHPILDATNLIQSGCITEVEMDYTDESTPTPKHQDENLDEEPQTGSKWDNFDCSFNNLAKLDGLNKPLRSSGTMEQFLQLEDDLSNKPLVPGQKRVRWADLEEREEQKKMRAIGFVVGQTDWGRMMDTSQGQNALRKTKYIEKVGKQSYSNFRQQQN